MLAHQPAAAAASSALDISPLKSHACIGWLWHSSRPPVLIHQSAATFPLSSLNSLHNTYECSGEPALLHLTYKTANGSAWRWHSTSLLFARPPTCSRSVLLAWCRPSHTQVGAAGVNRQPAWVSDYAEKTPASALTSSHLTSRSSSSACQQPLTRATGWRLLGFTGPRRTSLLICLLSWAPDAADVSSSAVLASMRSTQLPAVLRSWLQARPKPCLTC